MQHFPARDVFVNMFLKNSAQQNLYDSTRAAVSLCGRAVQEHTTYTGLNTLAKKTDHKDARTSQNVFAYIILRDVVSSGLIETISFNVVSICLRNVL